MKNLVAMPLRAWLFLSLLSNVFLNLSAQAARTSLPEIIRPQTGGEWVQAYIPAVETQAETGVQTFLDEVKIAQPAAPVLIDAKLLEQLKQNQSLSFSNVRLEDPENLGLRLNDSKSSETPVSDHWTLERFNQVAEALVAQGEKQHRVCRISFTGEGETPDEKPTLVIHVKPMTIQAVEIEGNPFFKHSAIQRQLGLKSGSLLNPQLIEKRIRLLQDNPDIRIQAKLEPVELDNAAVLHVELERHLPMHVSGFWNNLDRTPYGNMLSGVSYTSNNATGNGDTWVTTAITDPQVHGVFSHYEVPINAHGTRLGLSYSYLRANPVSEDFRPYRIHGKIWTLTSTLSQTLIARENLRATADLNFDMQQAHTVSKRAVLDTNGDGVDEVYHNTTIEEERFRDLRIGFQLQHNGKRHEFSTRQEFSIGLPIMGATLNGRGNLGNFGGGSQYIRYLGTFYYMHNLPHSLIGVLSGTAQWSPGTLPSTAVGALGGAYLGRGYPEVLLQGDSLVFVSSELRAPLFVVPKRWKMPMSEESIRDQVHLLTFVDYGYSRVNDRSLFPDPTEHILSVGVGVRAELSKYLSARCDLGIPLLKQTEPINRYGPRIHFGLQANLF